MVHGQFFPLPLYLPLCGRQEGFQVVYSFDISDQQRSNASDAINSIGRLTGGHVGY
jgi:hypothetical protein